MKEIINTEELISLFNLSNDYYEQIILKDKGIIGFSIKRQYPSNISYKPLVNKEGNPITCALFHIILDKNNDSTSIKDRLILSVTHFNKYLENHYDYDFTNDESPTEEAVRLNKNIEKPINLENNDSFFYDRNLQAIVNEKGKPVKGDEILKELFEKHCQTVHPLKGLLLRAKIKTGSSLAKYYDRLEDIVEFLLLIIWDREIIRDKSTFFGKLMPASLKLLNIDSINIFGYKVSKKIAVLFSFSVLFFFTVFYLFNVRSEYIKIIFTNGLLAVCFIFASLFILDTIFPYYILIFIINVFRKLKWHYTFKRYKI